MATAVETDLNFTHLPHPNPVADDVRAAAIADPAFGRVFTDHMVSIRYTEGQGWHDAQVMPRGPLTLDEYDNPIQNVYISKIEKQKHPVLGEVLIPVPVKTYEGVSQFWTWKPEEFLARGPYKR